MLGGPTLCLSDGRVELDNSIDERCVGPWPHPQDQPSPAPTEAALERVGITTGMDE